MLTVHARYGCSAIDRPLRLTTRPRCGNSDLEDAFKSFGPVTRCEVVRDPYSKQSRGFGFVTYESTGDANEAARAMDG